MNLAAVFHQRSFRYCTVLPNHRAEIKLQTGIEIKQVSLIHGDPYLWQKEQEEFSWKHKETTMELIGTTRLHKFWSVSIICPTQRLKYYFRLQSPNQTLCYGDRGFFKDTDYQHWSGFFLPYVWNHEALNPPHWPSETIWYQIFFDRFSDGNPLNNRKDGYQWHQPCDHDGYFGGDGQGVLNHLENLRNIGFTGIYFTPIFLAKSNHKYDTIDYYQIDPDFGDLEVFKQIVNKAHQLGMKVMLDGVFNHSGTDFFAFKDVMAHGKASKYYNWYHIEQLNPPKYQTFGTTPTMPKLNTANPEVQDYFLEVMKYWIRETKIDAWRIDVANEMAHRFFQRMYQEIKKEYPNFYLLAEIWHDPINWLDLQFDAAMNYQLGFMIKDLINSQDIDTFIDQFYTYQYHYPTAVKQTTFTLLDSHDTHRLRYLMGNDLNKTLLALALLIMQQGGICMLYGSEYALLGEKKEHARALYPIQPTQKQLDFKTKLQRLLTLRSEHIEIINHQKTKIYAKDQLFYYEISEKLCLITNLSDKEQPLNQRYYDLFSEKKDLKVLKPYQFIITKI